MRYDKIQSELVREITAELARRDMTYKEFDKAMGRNHGYWTAIKARRKRFEARDIIDAARVFKTTPSQLLMRAEFRIDPALVEQRQTADFDLVRIVEELGVVSARLGRLEGDNRNENGG